MPGLWISLSEDDNNAFHVASLLRHLIAVQRDFIVQGQQHVALANHTKQSSLDYWIRNNVAQNNDTAQATNAVLTQLCNTGLFVFDAQLICPDSGNACRGIRIVNV
jgi:hypothetical protein